MATSAGSVTFVLPATAFIADRKQADQPAAKSCSGLVPAPGPPGDDNLTSSAPVRAARAAVAAARGMGFGGVQDFFEGHGELLSEKLLRVWWVQPVGLMLIPARPSFAVAIDPTLGGNGEPKSIAFSPREVHRWLNPRSDLGGRATAIVQNRNDAEHRKNGQRAQLGLRDGIVCIDCKDVEDARRVSILGDCEQADTNSKKI